MVSDKLLTPLHKTEGPRSIVKQCYDGWIAYRLAWDERLGGRITKASTANREHPLLRLPPELRTAIWDYVLEPQFDPDSRLSVEALDKIVDPERRAQYLAGRTVDLFPPRTGVYPHHSILLISRNLYAETLAMYNAAVLRYYESIPIHLKSNSNLPNMISSTASRKIASMSDVNLSKIKTLVIDNRTSWRAPEMLFTDGAWRVCWRMGYGSQTHFESRRVIFFEPSKATAIANALVSIEWSAWPNLDYVRKGSGSHRGKTYAGSMEAIVLENASSDDLMRFRAAAESDKLTKSLLLSVLEFQRFMRERF